MKSRKNRLEYIAQHKLMTIEDLAKACHVSRQTISSDKLVLETTPTYTPHLSCTNCGSVIIAYIHKVHTEIIMRYLQCSSCGIFIRYRNISWNQLEKVALNRKYVVRDV